MSNPPTVVAAESGACRGEAVGGAVVWRGIPYAAAPSDTGRFLPPAPASPWPGVRNCVDVPPRAVQVVPARTVAGRPPPETTRISEDCLALTVAAPVAADAAPVVVWIHGGGFANGSGSYLTQDGRALTDLGIVVVTVNYRLGALGFLELTGLLGPAYEGSGNLGVLDQVAALRWVRRNIAAFGGDPERVTVMGLSAGAKSIATLLALPRPRELFDAAIMFSGGAETSWTGPQAERLARRLVRALGPHSVPADLLSAPAEQLLRAQAAMSSGLSDLWTWRPTLDGVVLPGPPLERIAAGSAAGIPVLVSTSYREGAAFADLDPSWRELTRAMMADVFGAKAPDALAAHARARAPVDGEAEVAALTAERYWMPSVRLAEAASAHADAWMLRYDWRDPSLGRSWAGHGSESALIWDTTEGRPAAWHRLAAHLRALIAGFATARTPVLADGRSWPRYDAADRVTCLLTEEPTPTSDPDSPIREVWQDRHVPYGDWQEYRS